MGLIDRLGDPLPSPIVTEHFLRSVSELDEFEQMSRLQDRTLKRSNQNSQSGSPDEIPSCPFSAPGISLALLHRLLVLFVNIAPVE